MAIATKLKDNSTHSHPRSPMIERALARPHTTLVPLCIHSRARRQPHEQPEISATHPSSYHILAVLELRGGDGAVVVAQTQPVVTPDDGAAFGAAAR